MMTKEAKWILVVAGVTAFGGTGAWLYAMNADSGLASEGAKVGAPVEAGDGEELTAYVPLADREGCAFRPGMEFGYTVQSEARARLDLSGLTAGLGGPQGAAVPEQDVRATMRARLEMRVLSTDAEWGSVLVGRYVDVEANQVVEDERLEAPFLVRIGPDCAIDGFAHEKGVDAGYARVQQALLYELSWAWPEDDAGRLEGRNGYGTFTAAVDSLEHGGEVAWMQGLTNFEPWSREQGSVERVTGSYQRVVPGRVAWFETMEGNISFAGPRSTVEHTTRARFVDGRAPSLSEASGEESDYVWADLLPHEIPLNERQPPTEAELRALAEARRLSVDEAVDQYVARAQDEAVGIQDTWPGLRTYLEARPEAAQEVIEVMKRREMPSEATMGAYIALGNARTDEAREALEGVMRDVHAPVIERSRAVLALIDRPDVGMELAGYLGQQSQALVQGENAGERVMARQSLLALGAMSGRKAYDEEIKQAALSQIARLLEETADQGAAYQRPVFGALANVGDADSLHLVAHIPEHPDADVREAAAIVFRRMAPAESAEFAARWLAQESDANVKRALWHTIELQTFDARAMMSREVLEYALRDLETRPGVITRKALIRLLGRALRDGYEGAGAKDDLGIEDAFVALLPYEFEEKSGFHRILHDYISPERREEAYQVVAREMEGDTSVYDGEGVVPAEPSDEELTMGGLVLPAVTTENEEVGR